MKAKLIFPILLLFIIGCSQQSSVPPSSSSSSTASQSTQPSDTINIEVQKIIKNSFNGAVSPDESYIALISNQYPLIIKVSDLSSVYVSKTQFPQENFYYGNTEWSPDGNYALFSYYSLKDRKGATLLWNKSSNQELMIPSVIRSSWDNRLSRVFGYNIDKQSIYSFDLSSQKVIEVPKQSISLPQYCKIDDFNGWNGDTILFVAEIYPQPGKYDHTEMLSLDLGTQTSSILSSSIDKIDVFQVSPDKQKAFIVSLPENAMDLLKNVGKSGFFDLANMKIEDFNIPYQFHSYSIDGKKVLCTIKNSELVYGLYDIESGKVFLLKDTSGNPIESRISGTLSKNFLLLQTNNDQIYLCRIL